MKWVCLLCRIESQVSAPWCQEYVCKPVQKIKLFSPGQRLAGVEILSVVQVLTTAAIYEGELDGKRCWIKVAHIGSPLFVNLLERELRLFYRLSKSSKSNPAICLIPFNQSKFGRRAEPRVSEMTLGNQTYNFSLYEVVRGESLRAYLNRYGKLPIEQAIWIIMKLLEVTQYLHEMHICHLALESTSIYLSGKRGTPQPLLLDGGALLSVETSGSAEAKAIMRILHRQDQCAPELTSTPPTYSFATDVYGIGVLLYEMATDQKLLHYLDGLSLDHEADNCSENRSNARGFDDWQVATITLKSVQADPEARYCDLNAFYMALREHFSAPPLSRRESRLATTVVVLLTLFALAVITLLSIS